MNPFPLTRRQFLLWSGALGASAALPLSWMDEEPVRLGFVGLGGRGRRALSTCLRLPGAQVVALCDRREDLLNSAVAGPGASAELATREARRLFAAPWVDAVVLAASQEAQLELTVAACAAGKDVFLLRPLPCDPAEWKTVAEDAARHGRQIQVARETTFALEAGGASGLVASGGGGLTAVEVEAWFQTPQRTDAGALLSDLLDEVDFAQALLGGQVERAVTVGGSAILPGRWTDCRAHFEIADPQGVRSWMAIHLVAARGPAAPKASRVLLRGDRGAAELAGAPLPSGDSVDLGVFLGAVRSRQAGVGLSLSRAAELSQQFLATGQA